MRASILFVLFTCSFLFHDFTDASTDCKFNKNFIQEKPAQDKSIAHQHWRYSKDPDSDEHVKTLYIIYSNGDQAVIEHKYCLMYNFELAYFAGKSSATIDQKLVGRIVEKHVKHYSAMLNNTSAKIENDVIATLNKHGFSGSKPLNKGIDSVLSKTENTELAISYMPYENIGSIYTAIVGFYLGVGGQ